MRIPKLLGRTKMRRAKTRTLPTSTSPVVAMITIPYQPYSQQQQQQQQQKFSMLISIFDQTKSTNTSQASKTNQNMFSKYFAWAASALFLASVSAQPPTPAPTLEIFNWNINLDGPPPDMGEYPLLNFDDNEVSFQYSYGGVYDAESKFFTTSMLMEGCLETIPEGETESLVIKNEAVDTANKKLTFDIDVLQSIVTESSYYADGADFTAEIKFCVRVDYNTVAESVNFHETEVTLTVDLIDGFQLTGIAAELSAAMQTGPLDADVLYNVTAYHCDGFNQEIAAPVYSFGDLMQVCIRVADELVGQDIYVDDILEFDISQNDNGSGPPANPTNAINGGVPDALTLKDCDSLGDGRCNVLHQLTSKFFTETQPGTLQVDGIALLAFGSPAGRRLQAVKVQGSIQKPGQPRDLVEGTYPEFHLEVELAGEDDGNGDGSDGENSDGSDGENGDGSDGGNIDGSDGENSDGSDSENIDGTDGGEGPGSEFGLQTELAGRVSAGDGGNSDNRKIRIIILGTIAGVVCITLAVAFVVIRRQRRVDQEEEDSAKVTAAKVTASADLDV